MLTRSLAFDFCNPFIFLIFSCNSLSSYVWAFFSYSFCWRTHNTNSSLWCVVTRQFFAYVSWERWKKFRKPVSLLSLNKTYLERLLTFWVLKYSISDMSFFLVFLPYFSALKYPCCMPDKCSEDCGLGQYLYDSNQHNPEILRIKYEK